MCQDLTTLLTEGWYGCSAGDVGCDDYSEWGWDKSAKALLSDMSHFRGITSNLSGLNAFTDHHQIVTQQMIDDFFGSRHFGIQEWIDFQHGKVEFLDLATFFAIALAEKEPSMDFEDWGYLAYAHGGDNLLTFAEYVLHYDSDCINGNVSLPGRFASREVNKMIVQSKIYNSRGASPRLSDGQNLSLDLANFWNRRSVWYPRANGFYQALIKFASQYPEYSFIKDNIINQSQGCKVNESGMVNLSGRINLHDADFFHEDKRARLVLSKVFNEGDIEEPNSKFTYSFDIDSSQNQKFYDYQMLVLPGEYNVSLKILSHDSDLGNISYPSIKTSPLTLSSDPNPSFNFSFSINFVRLTGQITLRNWQEYANTEMFSLGINQDYIFSRFWDLLDRQGCHTDFCSFNYEAINSTGERQQLEVDQFLFFFYERNTNEYINGDRSRYFLDSPLLLEKLETKHLDLDIDMNDLPFTYLNPRLILDRGLDLELKKYGIKLERVNLVFYNPETGSSVWSRDIPVGSFDQHVERQVEKIVLSSDTNYQVWAYFYDQNDHSYDIGYQISDFTSAPKGETNQVDFNVDYSKFFHLNGKINILNKPEGSICRLGDPNFIRKNFYHNRLYFIIDNEAYFDRFSFVRPLLPAEKNSFNYQIFFPASPSSPQLSVLCNSPGGSHFLNSQFILIDQPKLILRI